MRRRRARRDVACGDALAIHRDRARRHRRGAPRRVVGDVALLIAAPDDAWIAIEDRCSHAGCAFSEDGGIDGDRVTCDCHGSEFDLRTGRAVVPRSPSRPTIAVTPRSRTPARDLKYGVGLNHLPSGKFAANGAWLAVQVVTHNLAR
ncbi:hypothetical protein BH20CHL7_BH20CHL7_16160 [soil metagenome]